MTYNRNRKHEIPTVCYACSNCQRQFEYFASAHFRTKSGRNFCSLLCKTEFYYLLNQMSQSQLNVLECLLQNGGHSKLLYSRSIDSLQHKITPLIRVIQVLNKHEVFAEITDRGKYWYELKVGIRV